MLPQVNKPAKVQDTKFPIESEISFNLLSRLFLIRNNRVEVERHTMWKTERI